MSVSGATRASQIQPSFASVLDSMQDSMQGSMHRDAAISEAPLETLILLVANSTDLQLHGADQRASNWDMVHCSSA